MMEKIGLKFFDDIVEETNGGWYVFDFYGNLVFRRKPFTLPLPQPKQREDKE